MVQYYVKDIYGKTHAVNVNNNTRASDVLRNIQKNGVDVNSLIIQGKYINGNTLMRNTNYRKETVHAIKRNRSNIGRRQNNRNVGRRQNNRNVGRRQNNHNVQKVKHLLSIDYIKLLKELKDEGQEDSHIKFVAKNTLDRMVDKYLIPALKKM